MAAEHDHFILLVGAGNLGDGVIGGRTFRVHLVDDVELELHRRAVRQNARNAAVILVAEDDRRQRFGCIVSAVAERDDLTVFSRGVVDAQLRAAGGWRAFAAA